MRDLILHAAELLEDVAKVARESCAGVQPWACGNCTRGPNGEACAARASHDHHLQIAVELRGIARTPVVPTTEEAMHALSKYHGKTEKELVDQLYYGLELEVERMRQALAEFETSATLRASFYARGVHIEFRPMLIPGMLAVSDEGLAILIDNEQPKAEQAHAVWHETLHLLLVAAGRFKHHEQAIDAAALRLAQACPEIVDLLKGVSHG